MSDSVDRVFVHALATVRRLPRTGSSRPPPSARLRLYGLYKQSMEGDVSAILPRPSLPISSPNPNDPTSNAVHRYASRDLRTRETQAEIEKWDAWHACEGMTRTEAKRKYISILIGTMKEYASGTSESRELVSELEFVWNQIKSQSGSDESEEGESPTRKLERAGLKRTDTNVTSEPDSSGQGRRESRGDQGGGAGGARGNREDFQNAATGKAGNGLFGFARMNTSSSSFNRDGSGSGSGKARRQSQQSQSHSNSQSQSQSKKKSRRPQAITTSSGLRILSPMSQGSSDDIVENQELSQLEPDAEVEPDSSSSVGDQERNNDEVDEAEDDNADESQALVPGHQHNEASTSISRDSWRTQMESHLQRLTLELTALREQLSAHSLLSRSTFSHPSPNSLPIDFALLPFRKRLFYRATGWIRWALDIIVRQLIVQIGILSVLVLYGRWKGDRRVEEWVKKRLQDFRKWLSNDGLGLGLVDWRLKKWAGYLRITI